MVTRYEVPNKIRAMGSLMQADELLSMVMASEYDALQLERDELALRRGETIAMAEQLQQEMDQLRQAAQQAATALDKLARLGNGSIFGNSEGNVIAQEALAALKKVWVTP